MEIFLDGKWLKKDKANTPIYEPGFLYAQGLFETMGAYNKKIFRLDSHLSRLIEAACRIRITLNCTKGQLRNIIKRLVSLSSYKFQYVRLTVWQGENNAHVSVITKEYNPYPKEKYNQGARAILSSITQNEASLLANIKSSSRLHFLLAEAEARERNVDEAILLNSRGKIAEGTRANIFFVKNNTLFTPDKESGCLAGITRQTIMDIAKDKRIGLYEKEITPDELVSSDEAFLTNSLIGVMPLTFLDGEKIAKANPGRLTAFFMKQYQQLIERGK